MRTVVLCGSLLLVLLVGCAPNIGDECSTASDCDVQGNRICDRTQPGGYCTVSGCEQGTCPDDSVCILFRPQPQRLSASWCMAPCEDDGDCRDNYACTRASALGGEQNVLARALEAGDPRFCVATSRNPRPAVADDAGPGAPDAGVDAGAPDADAMAD